MFQKENGNTFTLLIIFIVKSLQKEQNSTNLLLWPQSAGIKLQLPQSDSTPSTLNSNNYAYIYWFNALSYIHDSGQLLTRPDSFVLDTALTTYSLHYTTIIEQRSRLLTNISDSCISLYLNCLTLWILPTFSKWS